MSDRNSEPIGAELVGNSSQNTLGKQISDLVNRLNARDALKKERERSEKAKKRKKVMAGSERQPINV